jgi:hypothetical protein
VPEIPLCVCANVDFTIQDMGEYILVRTICLDCGLTKFEDKLYKEKKKVVEEEKNE